MRKQKYIQFITFKIHFYKNMRIFFYSEYLRNVRLRWDYLSLNKNWYDFSLKFGELDAQNLLLPKALNA